MDKNYGVITEQGDLGLGFTPITESERNQIQENINNDKEKDEHEK